MYIAILGRQPAIGMAELERVFGDTKWFSDQSALINTSSFDIERLGGTQKAGRVVAELPHADWRRASMQLVKAYASAWSGFDGKITLGLSAYGFDVSPREVQKTGIILKGKLKDTGVSLRLIPNSEIALNTATSHHNKLGLSNNKVELLIVRARNGRVIIAESTGAQNITALARRDQERPKRDAFVGMLPPKLAQIMINLAIPTSLPSQPRATRAAASAMSNESSTTKSSETSAARVSADAYSTETRSEAVSEDFGSVTAREHSNVKKFRLLDPFCGTGVLLQEALLLGYDVYGTDIADKMIDFSEINLKWIKDNSHTSSDYQVHQGDAMTTMWQQPIDSIACESYLGQPFSAPPSPAKLTEVRGNCDHIISTFLKNIHGQIMSGTPLCVAVPAWRSSDGSFTHLPLIGKLSQLGYQQVQFQNVRDNDLLYYREDQVVARELLVLTKI